MLGQVLCNFTLRILQGRFSYPLNFPVWGYDKWTAKIPEATWQISSRTGFHLRSDSEAHPPDPYPALPDASLDVECDLFIYLPSQVFILSTMFLVSKDSFNVLRLFQFDSILLLLHEFFTFAYLFKHANWSFLPLLQYFPFSEFLFFFYLSDTANQEF